ncbi:Lipoprotein, putative, partial [Candidatus Arthromitus sp. SFB-5]
MRKLCLLLLISLSMVSCTNRTINMKSSNNAEVLSVQRNYFKSDFDIEVNSETFTLMVKVNGSSEYISKSLSERKVSNFKKESDKISWTYEEEGIDVLIENKGDHIDVSIKSTKDDENEFTWPKISGDEYILPIGQGKKIPSNDEVWKKYFTQIESIKGIEGLSM